MKWRYLGLILGVFVLTLAACNSGNHSQETETGPGEDIVFIQPEHYDYPTQNEERDWKHLNDSIVTNLLFPGLASKGFSMNCNDCPSILLLADLWVGSGGTVDSIIVSENRVFCGDEAQQNEIVKIIKKIYSEIIIPSSLSSSILATRMGTSLKC